MRSLFVLASAGLAVSIAGVASGQTGYGITIGNRLVSFDPTAPGTIGTNVAITGLQPGEDAVGLDARPLTGQLLVMGSSSRLYFVDPSTGVASAIGTGFSGPALAGGGNEYGIDFNPTVDRVRLVQETGQNSRLNPLTGATAASDTNLSYPAGGTPQAVGTAYRFFQFGSNAPVGSVRQYIIDWNGGNPTLGEVGSMAGGNASFNGGVVTPIGSLGQSSAKEVGFDIFGPTDAAYVSIITPGNTSARLYTLNLATGAATTVGVIGDGTFAVRDITFVPTPGAAAILGLAGLVIGRRRR